MTVSFVSGLSDVFRLLESRNQSSEVRAIFNRAQSAWQCAANSATSHEYWLQTKANCWKIRHMNNIIGKRILSFFLHVLPPAKLEVWKKEKRSHVTTWQNSQHRTQSFFYFVFSLCTMAGFFSFQPFTSAFLFSRKLRVPKRKENYKQIFVFINF